MGSVKPRTPSRGTAGVGARRPSVGGAALRSALVPGWGQWAAGRRRRGLGLAAVTLVLAGIPLVAAAALLRAFIPLPDWLRDLAAGLGEGQWLVLERLSVGDWQAVWHAAAGANAAAGLWRAWAAFDAAACARAARRAAARSRPAPPPVPPSGRALGVAAAGVAAVLVVAPHVAALAAGYAAQPLFTHVLRGAGRPDKPAAPPAPAAEAAAAEAEASRPLWESTGRLNVLLVGTDRRPQEAAERPWGNSDTLLLVSVEGGGRAAAMISVPRDLYVDIPGVGPEKINAAYREGGPALAVRVVGDLLGVPVHRWASIDVPAFARLIDALGGVVVDVERPIRDDEFPAENYATRRILLQAGLQWLDGERALWYVRSRHGSTDFDRAARQQRLLLSLKDRVRDTRTIARLPALINSFADAVQTDVTPREALALARLATSPEVRADVRSLVLAPPAYGREVPRPNFYAIQPDVPRIQAAVADVLAGRPAPGVVASPAAPDGALGDGAPAAAPSQGGAPDDPFQEAE